MESFPTPKQHQYKVYVHTCTFNHAVYIEDNLKGVAMQQTDFPFVQQVIDDCSTDGEQEVIMNYLHKECDMDNAEFYDNELCNITIAVNKSNPNCTVAVYLLKRNMYNNPKKLELFKTWRDVCKYEALCEGDDYWISSNKLQQQHDVLENNPDCSMATCTTRRVNNDGSYAGYNIPLQSDGFSQGKISLHDFLKTKVTNNNWCFHFNSFMIRLNFMDEYINEWQNGYIKGIPYGDFATELFYFSKGYMYYIDACMSCYRNVDSGLSHSYIFTDDNLKILNHDIKETKALVEFTKAVDENLVSYSYVYMQKKFDWSFLRASSLPYRDFKEQAKQIQKVIPENILPQSYKKRMKMYKTVPAPIFYLMLKMLNNNTIRLLIRNIVYKK